MTGVGCGWVRVAVAAAAWAVVGGCLDSGKTGRVGAQDDSAVEPEADAVNDVSDGAAGDVAEGDTAGPWQPDVLAPCPNPRVQVETHVVAPPVDPWHLTVMSEALIWFSGDPNWGGAPEEVFVLNVTDGAVVASSDVDPGGVVLDGREGAVLRLALSPREGRRAAERLEYRTLERTMTLSPDTAGERVLESQEIGRRHRLVSFERAAWRSCVEDDYGHCASWTLKGWRGDDVQVDVLWDEVGDFVVMPTAPFVDRAGVTWAEPTQEGWRIRTWEDGDARTVREVAEPVSEVARLAGGTLWLAAARAWFSADGAAVSAVGLDGCGAVDSDGAVAVLLCTEDPDEDNTRWSPFPAAAGALWLFDGQRTWAVPRVGAVTIAPQVDHGLVAWLAYPEPTDGRWETTTGQVWVAPVARPGGYVAVGTVGLGCYTCGSSWPEVALSLHQGLMAWNYAPVDVARAGGDRRGGGLGWAKAGLRCD